MAQIDSHLSTGLRGLDSMLKGLIPGDNLVWQVESIEDYAPFLPPYCRAAEELGLPLIYFRFAKHRQLIPDGGYAEVHRCDPQEGLEVFLSSIHSVIERHGRGGYYVFDCLSDLACDWRSDQMLGNFFMLTCPYLYDVEAIAYFALMRNRHSVHATSAISDTAQVLLNVYRHKEQIYLHPWKVQARHSATMHMPHIWQDNTFRPITDSATVSEIMTSVPWGRLESGGVDCGIRARARARAEEVVRDVESGRATEQDRHECLRDMLQMLVTRDERILALAEKYFTLQDVLDVEKRMIGTGLVGGKAVGMLLARAIIRAETPHLHARSEPHDSFHIGSDVFYSFLVSNGVWWVREQQKKPETFLQGAQRARHRILTGQFPKRIEDQFQDMLDYFGQSPIIVRSSSLLEDNFGNAFAGKYESVFCANQGPRIRRLDDFLAAVRTIYASCMSHDALSYREQRHLLDKDEQMALLVQRVSGQPYGRSYYFPQVAGVGFSFNPYVWNEDIDPDAGMLRLVFGLGTRAVDRSDDDYTRIVSLNAPKRRPEANFDQVRRYSQRKVDLIDLEANQLLSASFKDIVAKSDNLPVEWFASRDHSTARQDGRASVEGASPWVLTFDKLFEDTNFIAEMREMLQTLHRVYDCPVDVEFTANFVADGQPKTSIVQCRPLQGMEGGRIVDVPEDIPPESLIIESHGAVIGQGRDCTISRIIYVVPDVYGHLPITDRYSIARVIGRLTRLGDRGRNENHAVLLMGPGRWATSSPELGVPVTFSDISSVSVVCEIVAMRGDIVPDVSLGTHFFSGLVEMEMLYFALFPKRPDSVLNATWLADQPNRLEEILPADAKWADAVRVIDTGGLTFKLNANPLFQRVVGYVAP